MLNGVLRATLLLSALLTTIPARADVVYIDGIPFIVESKPKAIQATELNSGTTAERLEECEVVLESADEAIRTQSDTIDELSAQNLRLQRALDYSIAEQSKQQAWYKSPSVIGPVAFVVGVALGAYVVKGAK